MAVVYSRPGCQPCKATVRELNKQDIPHRVVDITRDPAAADRVRELGYQAVPVVEVGGKHWHGFRPDRIKALKEAA